MASRANFDILGRLESGGCWLAFPGPCYSLPMKLLSKWILNACALLLVAHFYSGVQVSGFGSALIAALLIGLLNTLVRPILVLLTLPVTLISLGLFLFVINALLFWAASGLTTGFVVLGFWAALVGSVIYSVSGIVIDSALQRLFGR